MRGKLIFNYSKLNDRAAMDREVEAMLAGRDFDPDIGMAKNMAVPALYYWKGDYPAALSLCDRFMAKFPDHPQLWKFLKVKALSYLQEGQLVQADAVVDEIYDKCYGYNAFSRAAFEIACLYARKGNTEKAVNLSNEILSGARDRKGELFGHAAIACVNVWAEQDTEVQAKVDLMLSQYTEEKEFGRLLCLVGEQYYLKGQRQHNASSKDSYSRSITLIERHLLGIVVIDPNGVLAPDTVAMEPPVLSEELESHVWYILGLDYWQLGQWFPAADAFMNSTEKNPNHIFAGSMYWLISDCYEKLKRDGEVSAEEADSIIGWGYQTLFDEYPDSRDVEYAAIQLGKIHLARGELVSACTYFNWFLDNSHEDTGQIVDIGRIIERMEGCSL